MILFFFELIDEDEGELTLSGGGVYLGGIMIHSSGKDSFIDPSL